MALYFVAFSFAGHWMEIIASGVSWVATGQAYDDSITANITDPYLVYGAGAVMCAFGIRPFALRFRLHPVAVWLLAGVCCAIVEYVSAQILVWRFGFNPFWDYSDAVLNFRGYVCLSNTLLFAAAATGFIHLICPRVESWITRQAPQQIAVWAALLVGVFGLAEFAPSPVAVSGLTVIAAYALGRHPLPELTWNPRRRSVGV